MNRSDFFRMSLAAYSPGFLYDLFSGMSRYSLSYVYRGDLNPQLTGRILSLAETNMNITGEPAKVQKRVFFIMLESLQNITRHQEAGEADDNSSFFVMQNVDREYHITSGNVVEGDKVNSLRSRLEMLNSLGQEELKEYFKEVLATTQISEKGGAGLGLIEMARRSGNKLAFDFETLDELLSYFYFQVRISSEESKYEGKELVNAVKQVHALTRKHHINLIYHGLFTHDNLKSLLGMTEGSVVANDDLAFRRKSVNIMIELLQNISHHGGQPDPSREGRPGILIVSYANGECLLSAGNYIDNRNVGKLRDKLETVNRSGPGELDKLYTEIMLREDEAGAKGAGLGFVDMKMKSGNNLEFAILPLNDQFSFFTLQVKVSS